MPGSGTGRSLPIMSQAYYYLTARKRSGDTHLLLVNSKSIGTAMGVQGYPAVPILLDSTSKWGGGVPQL